MGQNDLIDLDLTQLSLDENEDDRSCQSVEKAIKNQIVSYYSNSSRYEYLKLVDDFYLTTQGGRRISVNKYNNNKSHETILNLSEYDVLNVNLSICGGIDFQHREGSKVGKFMCPCIVDFSDWTN